MVALGYPLLILTVIMVRVNVGLASEVETA